jgi:hypothetical protein
MTYPEDLLSADNEYGGNYMMFRISIHSDSELAKSGSGVEFVNGEVARGKQSDIAGYDPKAMNAIGLIHGATVANASNVAGKMGLSEFGRPAQVGANTVIGSLAAGAAITAIGWEKKEYKMQTKAICLYMPSEVSAKYSMNWEEPELFISSGIAELATQGLKMTNWENILKAGGSAVNFGAAMFLKTPGVGQLMSKATGTTANPKKEQLFKSVDYRTFTFSYQFFPRRPEESQAVHKIIREFKLHMHPEFKDASQFLYIYPSEFDIVYFSGGQENKHIHRHTSCVLSDMNVSYTPQGVFTSFAEGAPVQINLTLTFKELALLTKKDIQQGY